MNFFISMGAEDEKMTKLQLAFLYHLKQKINEEIKEHRKQQKMEQKYDHVVYFEHDEDEMDEDPA